MDFQFSPQQELLRKSVREFAEGAIAPKVQHMEETDEVPWDLYKEMGKQHVHGHPHSQGVWRDGLRATWPG